jgi:hypothetical protein
VAAPRGRRGGRAGVDAEPGQRGGRLGCQPVIPLMVSSLQGWADRPRRGPAGVSSVPVTAAGGYRPVMLPAEVSCPASLYEASVHSWALWTTFTVTFLPFTLTTWVVV